MRPQDTRIRRRNLRETSRGIPTGRRATHPVETTYGRHRAERDRLARWQAADAEMAAVRAGED
jgi:hypothetical protein